MTSKPSSTTMNVPTLRYSIGDVVCPGDRLGTSRQVQPGPGTRVTETVNPNNNNNNNKGTTSRRRGANNNDNNMYGTLYATVVGRFQVEAATQDSVNEQNSSLSTRDTSSSRIVSQNEQPLFQCHVQPIREALHQDSSSSTTTPMTSTSISSSTPSSQMALRYVPQVGQLVIGRIVRITPQNAVVQFLVLEGVGPMTHLGGIEGTIKREDVTGRVAAAAVTTDSNPKTTTTNGIARAFQPSDIVACRIISVNSSSSGGGGGSSSGGGGSSGGDSSSRQRSYDLSTAEIELGVLHGICSMCRTPDARLIPKTWREMVCVLCGHTEPRKVAKPGGGDPTRTQQQQNQQQQQ